ncbi:MAG: helix-turn-helix domain-containing protein, partial [Treponema sp.]|nr:helix-turn-helix domain-containing protein [Treponema sp.]
MESLGSILKSAREAKGYTIDFVSRETNIAGRYLDALEREDFSVFPGEPYLLGFLKNYGAYLELNVNELLSLYRSFKIQEQPVPVEELLKPPSRVPGILGRAAIGLVVLCIVAGGIWFFLTHFSKPAPVTPPARSPVQYTMDTDSMERRFYQGDSVLVSVGSDSYKLVLSGLGDTVTLTAPSGPVSLDLSQEAGVDLNGDGFPDLTVTVSDFAKNNINAGALLRFDLNTTPAPEPQAIADEGPVNTGTGTIVLMTSANPFPFTLQAAFQGYCLFRWEILAERDKPGRNEQYFQNSDELNIQAQNGIRLGLSNAQAVKLQVIGGSNTVPLEAGGPG